MSGAADRAAEWIYRGMWGALVKWLRVPDEPPNAPPGGGAVLQSVRPAPGFLRYLKFSFWILLFIIDAAILGIWVILLVASPVAGIITAPLFWAVAIIPDIFAYAALHVRYDTTWYVVTERGVRIRRGVWIITENTITFENVQNVTVRQGPVQRHFGIADVVVQTAGGGGMEGAGIGAHQGVLEGVDNASELRTLIMQRAEASRSAGLGDDRDEHTTGSGFGPQHLAVLRQIRDALSA